VQEYAREPRLTAPTWAGMTDDGASLTVSAAEARPGPAEARAPTATALRAVLDTPDGGKTELVADAGLLDQAAGALTVTGSVVVTTSTGWRVESDAMTARLDRTGVISPGPVTAQGPAGDLEAARMEITSDPERPGAYLMVFNGGVRLLYQPPDQEVLP
jgi:lipopolysaccharide export system protein LptC